MAYIVLIVPALLIIVNLIRQRWHNRMIWQIAGRTSQIEDYFSKCLSGNDLPSEKAFRQ
jgi:hypothetical protein